MRKTYEFKNDKYNIVGYTMHDDEAHKYKTDIIYGEEDYTKWLLNVNGKEVAFWNTGNNIVCNEHVIIEDDELNIITDFDYFKIDLRTLKCLTHIELEDIVSVTCELIKYRNGFLILCDLELVCIEDDKIKWSYDSSDIVENVKLLDNDIIKFDVLDSYGEFYYHVYLDKDGKRVKKSEVPYEK